MSKLVSSISVDDGGAGSVPVVFVHSLAGNTQQWSAQLDHVRETRRAIALDLRGHGQSLPPANGDYAMDAMAEDIQKVVDGLGIQRFVLVGHSMGGGVAVACASAHPERVAGLLLVDPSGDSTKMPPDQAQQYLAALESEAYASVIEGYWQQLLSGSTEATAASVMQDLRATPKATVVGVFQELDRFAPVPALECYPGLKLSIISSAGDTPLSLHNLVSDLPHKTMSGTGHWLQLDKPKAFNRMMDDFLASLGSDMPA